MNFKSLKILIDSEPANVNKSDVDAAAWVNAPSLPINVPFYITTRTIMGVLGATEGDAMLTSLELLAANDSVVARTLAMLEPSQQGIDVGFAGTRDSLDSLVNAGLLEEESVAQLKALAEALISPGVKAGIGHVTASLVGYARTGSWL